MYNSSISLRHNIIHPFRKFSTVLRKEAKVILKVSTMAVARIASLLFHKMEYVLFSFFFLLVFPLVSGAAHYHPWRYSKYV